MAIIDFDALMERIIPYDETQSKELFLKLISVDYPELKEKLKQELSEDNEWTRKAREGEDVYFTISNTHWKKSGHRLIQKIYCNYIENRITGKKLVIKVLIY